MKLSIYAKNMTVSPNVTRRIERKTEKMSRYLLPDTEMQIRMRKEKNPIPVPHYRYWRSPYRWATM